MGLFRVVTVHGTFVGLDPQRPEFVHGPNDGSLLTAQLYLPADGVGFLLGYGAEGGASGLDCAIWPLRVQRCATPGTCRLIDWGGMRLVTALPIAEGARAGQLLPDRIRTGPWETFELQPSGPAPSAVQWPLWEQLQRLAETRPTLHSIVAALDAEVLEWPLSLLRGYLQVLPDPVGVLPRLLVAHPTAMSRAHNSDPWLSVGLPELSRWLDDRDAAPSRRVIGPEMDGLAHLHGSPVPFGLACAAAIRSEVVPRRRACVLATARNEGVYLLEWIAYHRAIGFEHFFLYSNDNDDGSDPLLAALADADIITWIDNRLGSAVSPQLKAYAHALSLLPEMLDYEWVLIIDADEFMVFDTARFASVHDVLDWHRARPSDAIALNWLMYGTFGAIRFEPEQLLTRRFDTRHAEVNPHIKTLCRPHLFAHSHPHNPTSVLSRTLAFRDSSAEPYEHRPEEIALAATPVADSAWINHYWSKSIDEVLCKFARNRGDMANVASRPPAQIVEDVATRVLPAERGAVTERDDRIALCVPDLQRRIDELCAQPGVQVAADSTMRAFKAKVSALRNAIGAIDPATVPPEVAAVIRMMEPEGVSLNLATIGLS